jgi:hypothetical protein
MATLGLPHKGHVRTLVAQAVTVMRAAAMMQIDLISILYSIRSAGRRLRSFLPGGYGSSESSVDYDRVAESSSGERRCAYVTLVLLSSYG